MTRIVRYWLVGGAAALAAILAGPSTSVGLTAMRDRAGAPTHRSGAEVLHLKFRRAGSAGQVLVGRGYVYLGSTINGFLGGTLIDERTGKRWRLDRPNCGAEFFGGPWLLFTCGNSTVTQLALYRPATRTWRLVNWNDPALGQPEAVGAYWIESLLAPGCPDTHCDTVPSYSFTRIATGRQATVAWHPGGNIVPGLDSPSLAQRLCSPLRVPTVWDDLGEGGGSVELPGTVSMLGKFAIVSGTTQPGVQAPAVRERTFLERCRSKLHRLITESSFFVAGPQPSRTPIGDPHAILWPSKPQQLGGLFLPSLKEFTVPIPAQLGRVQATTGALDQVFLASRILYLSNGTQLWAAPAPRATSRRGIVHSS